MEYASRGVANTGLGFGIAGTALGLLGGGAAMLGMNPGSTYANDIDHRLRDIELLSQKDAEIARLQAEQISDRKDIEVYRQVRMDINNAVAPLKDEIKELQREARDQAVYNATNTAAVSVLGSQVNDIRSVLNGITAIHVPANVVCPEPMPLKNSWTAPTT